MFIIPCHNQENYSVIERCVERIKLHHPEDRILIVDSASPDKSYFDKVDCEVLDADNKNYAHYAYYLGYRAYPNEDYYYLIHDGVFVNSSMKQFEKDPVTVLRHFCSPPTGMGADDKGQDLTIWANEQLQTHVGISVPDYYYGVFGPIFFVQNQVMKQLEDCGYFDIRCQIKHHLSAMERMTGIILWHLGYDVSKHSLQGEMLDFFGHYDSTYAEKEHLLRP